MSNKALNWFWDACEADLIDSPGAASVMVVLADHATDHRGEDWTCFPSVKRIMARTRLSQSAVERHLLWLVAEGWISRTRYAARRREDAIYIYTLHRSRGLPPLGDLPTDDEQPLGDLPTGQVLACVGDLPTGEPEPVGELPTGDADDLSANQRPPVGDSASTCRQIGVPPTPPNIAEPLGTLRNPHSASARDQVREAEAGGAAFERVFRAWSTASKTAVARPRDLAAWARAAERVEPERLAAAATAYLAHVAAADDRVFSLAAWLRDERWEPWLDAPAAPLGAPPSPAWEGPAEVFDIAARRWGRDWAASWIAPCGWDDENRVILARTRFAAEAIGRELSKELKAAGIGVEFAKREG